MKRMTRVAIGKCPCVVMLIGASLLQSSVIYKAMNKLFFLGKMLEIQNLANMYFHI